MGNKVQLGIEIFSIIHSITSNIYIAPVQENYSEGLTTPSRLKRKVLRLKKNVGYKVLRKRHIHPCIHAFMYLCTVPVWLMYSIFKHFPIILPLISQKSRQT